VEDRFLHVLVHPYFLPQRPPFISCRCVTCWIRTRGSGTTISALNPQREFIFSAVVPPDGSHRKYAGRGQICPVTLSADPSSLDPSATGPPSAGPSSAGPFVYHLMCRRPHIPVLNVLHLSNPSDRVCDWTNRQLSFYYAVDPTFWRETNKQHCFQSEPSKLRV
jgi:hypothetical protein